MVSLTSVLILDNVSVKLKDDGDVCITMTPSLSPFSLLPPPPRHHRRSSFVRSRHFDPLGALGRLAADDTKCARRARVWRNKRWADFRVCCWARSLKRKLAGRTKQNKKKHMTVCIHRFILLWPFLLPLIRWYLHFRARESSQTTTVRLHSHLDWLQRNQVRKAINQ